MGTFQITFTYVKFEVGKSYFHHSMSEDVEVKTIFKVISRTEKTIQLEGHFGSRGHGIRRFKLRPGVTGEYVSLGTWAHAPLLSARCIEAEQK